MKVVKSSIQVLSEVARLAGLLIILLLEELREGELRFSGKLDSIFKETMTDTVLFFFFLSHFSSTQWIASSVDQSRHFFTSSLCRRHLHPSRNVLLWISHQSTVIYRLCELLTSETKRGRSIYKKKARCQKGGLLWVVNRWNSEELLSFSSSGREPVWRR